MNCAATSRALFYGESPAVSTMARQVRAISAALMALQPETWAALQRTEEMIALLKAASELRATAAAMSGVGDPAGSSAAPSCPVARLREGLREHRRRLRFLAENLQFTDRGARELLSEILLFDRWMGAHVARCPECRPGGAQ
jgi:hypothetical protein